MPTGHVLGLGSASSIAPNIIGRAYDGIVASIRQTGQEVAANVEKIQVGKQMKAFGQEISQLDPKSENFIPSMLGMASKYPLVIGSEQGKMAMTMLGQANKNLLERDNDIMDFNRTRALEGYKHRYRMDEIAARPSSRSMLGFAPGIGLYNKETGDIVEEAPEKFTNVPEGTAVLGPDGKVVMEARPRTTATPFTASGGMMVDRTQGTYQPLPLNANQEAQAGSRNQQLALKESQAAINSLQNDNAKLVAELKTTSDEGRIADIQRRIDRNRSELDLLTRVVADVAPQGPSAGTTDPLAIPNLGAPSAIPQVAPGPVITPDPQPAPQFIPDKIYRDKAGNRRRFKGGSEWEVLP
jgi:hypothetical protein